MIKIAVIDDDVYIGNMLEELLKKSGYAVVRAYSGTEALMLLSNDKPDIVLLDLMLPGLCGEEVLPKITGIPVIVLSAKADIPSKVKLLTDGAVDYITKPFDNSELLARIAVCLRKNAFSKNILNYNDLKLLPDERKVFIGENEVKLTKTEFAILKQLVINAPNVITKSCLLDLISIDTPDCMESSLKVHISNIRKKLKEFSDCEYIEAVWGIGFKISEKS